MTTRLHVAREEFGELVVLHVYGEVDLSNVELLEQALQQACTGAPHSGRVVVDATAITFLSAAGMAALVQAQLNCQDRGLDFAVAANQRAVVRALRVAGLDALVKIFPSLKAACETLARPDDRSTDARGEVKCGAT
jgi:anti-sigma B factor antagonist